MDKVQELLKKQTQQTFFELLQKYPKAKEKANKPEELDNLITSLYEMDTELLEIMPQD